MITECSEASLDLFVFPGDCLLLDPLEEEVVDEDEDGDEDEDCGVEELLVEPEHGDARLWQRHARVETEGGSGERGDEVFKLHDPRGE